MKSKDIAIAVLAWAGVAAGVFFPARSWVRWFRAKERFPEPRWRTKLAFAGLVLSTLAMLSYGIMFPAAIAVSIGTTVAFQISLIYVMPTLAVLGMVCGIVGKGVARAGAILGGMLMVGAAALIFTVAANH